MLAGNQYYYPRVFFWIVNCAWAQYLLSFFFFCMLYYCFIQFNFNSFNFLIYFNFLFNHKLQYWKVISYTFEQTTWLFAFVVSPIYLNFLLNLLISSIPTLLRYLIFPLNSSFPFFFNTMIVQKEITINKI